jgi:hypothetical protein
MIKYIHADLRKTPVFQAVSGEMAARICTIRDTHEAELKSEYQANGI